MKTFKDLKVGDNVFGIDIFDSKYLYKYKILEIEDYTLQDSVIKIKVQGSYSPFCIYMESNKSVGIDMFCTYYADIKAVLLGVIVQW